MQKIWETLSKPSELNDKQLSAYFDLSFSALPHKVLVPDKFEAEVQELKKRFVEKSRGDFVFSPAYHKRIPADGVAFYMEGIWVSPRVRISWCLQHIDCFAGTSPNQQRPGSSHSAGTARAIPLRRNLQRGLDGVQRAGQATEEADRDRQGRGGLGQDDACLAQ